MERYVAQAGVATWLLAGLKNDCTLDWFSVWASRAHAPPAWGRGPLLTGARMRLRLRPSPLALVALLLSLLLLCSLSRGAQAACTGRHGNLRRA